MSIIKTRALVATLAMIFMLSTPVRADEYAKLQNKITKISMKIASARCSVRKGRKYVKRLRKDIRKFNNDHYKLILTKRLRNTKERIKRNKKRYKRYLYQRKKLRKKLNKIKVWNGVVLLYSKSYPMKVQKLTKSAGVRYWNGHRETYYSQRVLPGHGLRIPGRHVANDGTIRDKDGYIVVAASPSFYSRGSKLMTTLGPAKVYDCGCAYGTIDIYVNW